MLNIELSIEWTEMPLELVIHGARNSCVVGIASVKEDGHDSATLLLPDYTKTQKTHPGYNARCPLLAHSGRSTRADECLLLGVKRT
jgi:hypothetical protein